MVSHLIHRTQTRQPILGNHSVIKMYSGSQGS